MKMFADIAAQLVSRNAIPLVCLPGLMLREQGMLLLRPAATSACEAAAVVAAASATTSRAITCCLCKHLVQTLLVLGSFCCFFSSFALDNVAL
jgi:hypothetical protein